MTTYQNNKPKGYYIVTVPKGLCDDVWPGEGLFYWDGEERLVAFGTKGTFNPRKEEWFKNSVWTGPLERLTQCDGVLRKTVFYAKKVEHCCGKEGCKGQDDNDFWP